MARSVAKIVSNSRAADPFSLARRRILPSAAEPSARTRPHSRLHPIAISAGILLALTAAGAGAARYIVNEAGLSPKTHSGKPKDRTQLQVADAGDPWTESLRSGAYWRNQPTETARPASRKRRHEKREVARSSPPASMRVESRAASRVSYSVSSVSARGSATYRTLACGYATGISGRSVSRPQRPTSSATRSPAARAVTHRRRSTSTPILVGSRRTWWTLPGGLTLHSARHCSIAPDMTRPANAARIRGNRRPLHGTQNPRIQPRLMTEPPRLNSSDVRGVA